MAAAAVQRECFLRRARSLRVVVVLALMLGGLVVASAAAPALAADATWSVVPAANPTSSGNFLYDVSCVSAKYCVAVGDSINTQSTLIETWNGTSWSVVPSPNPGTQGNELWGVSCVNTTKCFAVGDSLGFALIEAWDGTKWSVAPISGAANTFRGVSCVSATFCLAVGGSAATWNGVSWSVVANPIAPVGGGSLVHVSCVSASYCVAAGFSGGSDAAPQTLVEVWNGVTWSIVPSPNVASYDQFWSVACVSTSRCVAVGAVGAGGIGERPDVAPLVETWDGTRWWVTPSPAVEGDSPLTGVSCVTATSCVTVGGTSPSAQGLIEVGPNWTVTTSPSVPGGGARLQAVSCISVATCVAVGWSRGSLQTVSVAGPAKATPSPPAIVPGVGSVLEGRSGTTLLHVPVTLSFASTQIVTAQWRTVFVPGAPGHQADPATDYTAASGTVTFAPGETAKTVTITVHGDTLVEPNEYVIVQFGNATNAGIGGVYGLGLGGITNDD
jgi:hypothetical protein